MVSQPQKQFKIILIGDNCQDTYTYSTVDRISPEAPVPVCNIHSSFEKPGMAANVKENLEALGCDVQFYSGNLSTKTRIIDKRSNQHMLRIDNDVVSEPFDSGIANYQNIDAVVISDYNKGFVSYKTIEDAIYIARNIGIPVFVDTKKTDLRKINGSFVKINELEYNNLVTTCDDIIITKGGNSVEYNGSEYSVPKTEVVDVCGAGDTFLASLVYGYLTQGNIRKAIPFAIKASAVTVQKMGVYAPTLKEIE